MTQSPRCAIPRAALYLASCLLVPAVVAGCSPTATPPSSQGTPKASDPQTHPERPHVPSSPLPTDSDVALITYVLDHNGEEQLRPDHYAIDAEMKMTGITWETWGYPVAVGRGTLTANGTEYSGAVITLTTLLHREAARSTRSTR